MDRSAWLRAKRLSTEQRYDSLFAAIYDEQWGSTISTTHDQCFRRFLELCPPQAFILDAACGTGKYWPPILASGRTVAGLDQSQEMLNRTRQKFPGVPIEKCGLQELRCREAFDGACCVDAMEFVFPEDWPLVLGNLYRALRPASPLYFTVEIADEQEVEQAFAAGRLAGLPVVHGESALEAGYHYYPRIEQVRSWLQQAGFRMVDEAVGDEYHHFLVQANSPATPGEER